MELRHLRYFVAVAEELSFARAATRLHLAQPSLSTQIRNLEEELGVRLLERDRTHVALTDAGRVFLTDARDLLDRAEAAAKRAVAAAQGSAGELRIGTLGIVRLAFLPPSLLAFRKDHPDVYVSIRELTVNALLRQLIAGQLHLGFMMLPFAASKEAQGLERKLVARSPVLALINSHHPLARKRTIPLRALSAETFLYMRLNGQDGHRLWMESLCRKADVTPRFGPPAEGAESLAGMVAAGHGVSLISKLNQRPAVPGNVFRPVADPGVALNVFALWNPKQASRIREQFLEIIIKQATALERQRGSGLISLDK